MVNGKWKIRVFIFRASVILLTAYCSLLSAQAQIDEPPADAAAPPMNVIPREERKSLDDVKDLKKRTQLSLELLENHLLKAEQLGTQNDFRGSLNELGNYHAILENALKFLNSRDDGGNKVDNNFKRLEIGLRRTIPRLEVLRREMPYSYGYYVRELQKFVRDIRAQALEPLFSNDVVKQKNP